jgi:small nuclear ribonucleoprotein (snRNP)-like protein
LSGVGERRFFEELSRLLNKDVTVETVNGKVYSGVLSGVNASSMSVCLTDAKDQSGRNIHKLFINGSAILEVYSAEKPFDLEALAARLERVFPRMVKVVEGSGTIVVMDKIRVGEGGLIEGSGPTAERVKKVYEEFVRERPKAV